MAAFYNEIDPFAAEWIRKLIAKGHIADGIVDERDIRDIKPCELSEFGQCHFFAGIGVWSYALRQAGWPDDKPVWTGSCPCQPFSSAGRKAGVTDERHLWPHWFHLIEQCRPSVVFGEQVASRDGLGWLDLVQADLEGAHYAVGALDLCAAGFGAPHWRQRLYFVGRNEKLDDSPSARHSRPVERAESSSRHEERVRLFSKRSGSCELADSKAGGRVEERAQSRGGKERSLEEKRPARLVDGNGPFDSRAPNGFWRYVDWLFGQDGKWRPVEPGTFPLVDGAAARMGRLRGYGNAIVAPQAQAFIEAFLETEDDRAILS